MRVQATTRFGLALLIALATAASPPSARAPFLPSENDGDAGSVADGGRPTIAAAFSRESYRPGEIARLVVTDRARGVVVQVFHVDESSLSVTARDVMTGSAVGDAVRVGELDGRTVVPVRLADCPSGVYYARLTGRNGRIGYAPFVVRPRQLGEHRVAVVMPTQTWQAYNLRDGNGDGKGDSWYADPRRHTAELGRPFLHRGTPPHWKSNDLPFLQWLAATNRHADYLADTDLRAVRSGARLRAAYSLLIFPSHHEYVTSHEYKVVTGYRNHGGNLVFLSANNLFWQIVKRGQVMTRTRQWRDLGHPEAALIGVQYFHNDNGLRRGPWVIRDAPANAWLLAGTGLTPGTTIGSGGIEADHVTAESSKNVEVLAEIPNLYGQGQTAQMTYYESQRGAEVFAAGAFGLAGAARDPRVAKLLANLWSHLGDRVSAAALLTEGPGTTTQRLLPRPKRPPAASSPHSNA
jgi:hypothetical protein